MGFKYKIQSFQTEAVQAVVDYFEAQPHGQSRFRQDPGRGQFDFAELGFRNADVQISRDKQLANLRQIQRKQYTIEERNSIAPGPGSKINLDVEMETGTGKTYVYLKTIFELHKTYGWNKFIVMVPSVAIREGVFASIQSMAEHFQFHYGKRMRSFIYNSSDLSKIDSFASDGGINVMVINTQAFAARGKDARRIYEELDDFHTRRPIDVIASTQPILILDEPQKMEGKVTKEKLPEFKALAILRYSATHKTQYNLVYRLDALDAYNRKLVKKIAPVGVTAKGLAGGKAYLYLERIGNEKGPLYAMLEIEQKRANGTRVRQRVRVDKTRNDLFVLSNELEEYKGYKLSDILPLEGAIEFSNGVKIYSGEAVDDSTEDNLRRIQIREAVRAHLAREEQLHSRKIKVLSLFFIDTVAKYRDYTREDTLGEYARIFEEEYEALREQKLAEISFESGYHSYLKRDDANAVHEGYFSVDKKSKQLKDPKTKKNGSSDDVDAYDLILRKKETLLSLDEPVRFIFSHSALREGWDNPNVFVMCFLKHTVYDQKKGDHTRRQELGRGLRIAVQSDGQGGYVRMDDPTEVHDINVLTVVTDEQYSSYVKRLQEEYKDAVDGRPRRADKTFFQNKLLRNEEGELKVDEVTARLIERYLIANNYTDTKDQVTPKYYEAKEAESLAELPDELQPYEAAVHQLIQSVYTDAALPGFDRGNAGRDPVVNINSNYQRQEFQSLWSKINQQQVYQVDFSTEELIRNAIPAINRQLTVSEVSYQIERGVQKDTHAEGDMKQGSMFSNARETNYADEKVVVNSEVSYDLLGRVAAASDITRASAAAILQGIDSGKFDMYKANPEQFIVQVSRLIVEQKASLVVEHLTYDRTGGTYEADIFVPETIPFAHATEKLRKHVYDFVKTDSQGERTFAEKLDAAEEVVVYAKLPGRFKIPTPVGDYNPDWAIVFEEKAVKHIYFIAETKGSMSTLQLRGIEEIKIDCARKFFDRLQEQSGDDTRVRYDVVSSYGGLMDMVR